MCPNLPHEKTHILSDINEINVITPALANELKSGSEEAFKTIYLHYYAPLENFLFNFLKSKTEAEEIAQDVFLRLWEKRESIDPDKNIKSFIFTIARNSVMNLFRRLKVVEKYMSEEKWQNNSMSETSEDILIAHETELLVKLTISKMPSIRRKVCEMSLLSHLDNETIAKKLGIPKANVANHLSHARKDIKEAIHTLLVIYMFLMQF